MKNAKSFIPVLAFVSFAYGSMGCSLPPGELHRASRQPVIYGSDDRKEYYGIDDLALRDLIDRRSVALVDIQRVTVVDGHVVLGGPTWQAHDSLCPDVPFAAELAVAYCSGVLVTPDLVLTAGHCLQAGDCTRMAVVRNFRQTSPGTLATVTVDDVRVCNSIVAWSDGESNPDDRIDFAWVELDRPLNNAPDEGDLAFAPEPVTDGEPVTSFGYGGGGPVTLATGSVSSARQGHRDFFLTNIDAFAGMSGAPIFDQRHALAGIDDRGASDLTFDPTGNCYRPVRLDDDAGAEAATHAIRALEELCKVAPRQSVCAKHDRSSSSSARVGCQVSSPSQSGAGSSVPLAATVVWLLRRRRRARALLPRPERVRRKPRGGRFPTTTGFSPATGSG